MLTTARAKSNTMFTGPIPRERSCRLSRLTGKKRLSNKVSCYGKFFFFFFSSKTDICEDLSVYIIVFLQSLHVFSKLSG